MPRSGPLRIVSTLLLGFASETEIWQQPPFFKWANYFVDRGTDAVRDIYKIVLMCGCIWDNNTKKNGGFAGPILAQAIVQANDAVPEPSGCAVDALLEFFLPDKTAGAIAMQQLSRYDRGRRLVP